MVGGPSTPALVAAVVDAGGFAFVAGGSLAPALVDEQIRRTRELTRRRFGVNFFVPRKPELFRDEPAIARYARELEPVAARYGIVLAEPTFRILEGWVGRISTLLQNPVAVVSFTFGCPSVPLVDALHAVGTAVVVTATTRAEAEEAMSVGVDALCVQGADAGGHRGTHSVNASPNTVLTLDLVREFGSLGLPLVAAGGVAGPEDVRRLKDAGAAAVQCGTMFLLSDEAGTDATWRRAMSESHRPLVRSRAFTGRVAQGLNNRFIDQFDALAPPVYPQIDALTRPIRDAAAAAKDPDNMSLWAGAGWRSCRSIPASDIVEWLGGSA